jgi:hypothetical protein
LFGYFPAQPENPSELYAGGVTFACLSHDIVAHETTHAILDGIYRNFNNPTNPDQLAFHEAFPDLIALLQHFTITSVVESQIRTTRGSLEIDNALLELAREFGRATGMHGALRTALDGGMDPKTGQPDYSAVSPTGEIHARGAILVATIFDAFLKIYQAKTADLRRIASGGTGILPQGEIAPDWSTVSPGKPLNLHHNPSNVYPCPRLLSTGRPLLRRLPACYLCIRSRTEFQLCQLLTLAVDLLIPVFIACCGH